MAVNIKSFYKVIIFFSFFFVHSLLFSETINSMQLFKADSWVYKSLEKLAVESGALPVTFNAPLTAGEIKFYFSEIDREKLSGSGKKLYDEMETFLYEKPKKFDFAAFSVAPNLRINPEFYVKTNPQIDWTNNYYYKDNLLTADVMMSFSDYFLFDIEIFLGKNHGAMHLPYNFTNIPLSVTDLEFQTPTWTNFSTGYNFDTWGFNLVVGKEGLQVGRTITGSIVHNNTFKTDMFAQFNIFSRVFKFTMNVVEVDVNKFFYEHHVDVRLFKKFHIMVGEGIILANSFEPRFLIPLTLYHSYAAWNDYDEVEREYYTESRFCNTLQVMLEFTPFSFSRFYVFYIQNELQQPWESSYTPNSFGWQAGMEFTFDAPGNGFWNIGAEWIWTTPYLYVKHTPTTSLCKEYRPNHSPTGENVYSWLGSPYGPDCMGGAITFGYEKPQKWSADFSWIFTAHGEKGFDMFGETVTDEGKTWYYYYPAVRYKHAATEAEKEDALADAMNLLPSGTVEYKNQVSLQATYFFNKHFSLSGKIVYIFAFNHDNILNNFQQGAEFSISGQYTLF